MPKKSKYVEKAKEAADKEALRKAGKLPPEQAPDAEKDAGPTTGE